MHVSAGGRSACWALEVGGVLGGVLQVDWDEGGHGCVSVVVDPARRKRGLGTRLLRSFLDRHSAGVTALTASVSPENQASRALALRCGFELIGVDEEGFVQFQYRRISAGGSPPRARQPH